MKDFFLCVFIGAFLVTYIIMLGLSAINAIHLAGHL